MKNILIVIIVLILIGGAYSFFAGQNQTVTKSVDESKKTAEETVKNNKGETKTFEVSGTSFAFDPKEIKVKQGDTVKIDFKDTGGFHNLTIEGYNVQTKQIQAGQSDSIEFVADKTGTFEYFCNVDGHKEMGMVGKLIVE